MMVSRKSSTEDIQKSVNFATEKVTLQICMGQTMIMVLKREALEMTEGATLEEDQKQKEIIDHFLEETGDQDLESHQRNITVGISMAHREVLANSMDHLHMTDVHLIGEIHEKAIWDHMTDHVNLTGLQAFRVHPEVQVDLIVLETEKKWTTAVGLKGQPMMKENSEDRKEANGVQWNGALMGEKNHLSWDVTIYIMTGFQETCGDHQEMADFMNLVVMVGRDLMVLLGGQIFEDHQRKIEEDKSLEDLQVVIECELVLKDLRASIEVGQIFKDLKVATEEDLIFMDHQTEIEEDLSLEGLQVVKEDDLVFKDPQAPIEVDQIFTDHKVATEDDKNFKDHQAAIEFGPNFKDNQVLIEENQNLEDHLRMKDDQGMISLKIQTVIQILVKTTNSQTL